MTKRVLLAGLIILVVQLAWAAEGFDDILSETDGADEQSALTVDITGEIGLGLTYYLDDEWDSMISASPISILRVEARSDMLEGFLVFDLEQMTDVLDELYMRAFFTFGYLDVGLLKVEWGQGDGIHVIDPLNPLVQTGRVETDILKQKRAEVMAMMSFYLGQNGLLELVYKPFFHPHQFDTEGRWALEIPDIIPPDTETLAYSQAAARLTGSLGFFDLGALYYYGFMSEPGYQFETSFTGTDPLDPTHYTTTTELVFTRAQLFGLEGVLAAGPFTLRTELGYWLTEDTAGDQPELFNNRFVYLGGIDLMIPGTSIFLSIQVTGAYVLGYLDLAETDVDRMAAYDDTPHSTMIMGALDLPFARGLMKLRLSGLYLIQAGGFLLLPEYSWKIKDDLELRLSGQILGGKDTGNSPYQTWDTNDNVGISITYTF
ncbi:MAG TPA: hypothetical protein ENI27_06960 [bacterium]|nr:hypothetical protein [bacterium]